MSTTDWHGGQRRRLALGPPRIGFEPQKTVKRMALNLPMMIP